MNSDVKEMEIADYAIVQNIKASLYRLWKLKLVPLLAMGMGALLTIAYLIYVGDEKNYYASATIYSAVYGSYSETVSGVSIMNTYSSLLGSSRVCERAAAEISDDDISSGYLANLVRGGMIRLSGASESSKSYGYKLVISTSLNAPDNVIEITNAMAKAFSSEINELLGADVIQVFDEATYVRVVARMSKKILVLLVGAVAFVAACAVICIKEFFSSKVFLVSQCELDRDKILGIIPYNNK